MIAKFNVRENLFPYKLINDKKYLILYDLIIFFLPIRVFALQMKNYLKLDESLIIVRRLSHRLLFRP